MNRRTPSICVVTPSFNQREFIESTLSSVLDQAYPGLEYVVIDGGSTDGSVDVIRRHEGGLTFWSSEPDRGHAHAVNKGFARTTAEIMCWVNSSDMHYPWTLETVAQVFTDLPDVDWIIGVPSILGSQGGPKSVGPAFYNKYDFLAGDYRWVQQESVFWRRRLWDRAGGRLDDSLTCAADFDLWLRFLPLSPLCHVETVLGGWRVHDDPLGAQGGGLYERETSMLISRFAAGSDRRARRRGRLVRALASGRRKTAGQALHKYGVWPWYRHPRVLFDFERERWVLR